MVLGIVGAHLTIQAGNRAGGREHPHRTNRTRPLAPLVFFFVTVMLFKSKTSAFALWPSQVRPLLCVSRTDFLGFWWCSAIALRSATAVLGNGSRCLSIPHSHSAHLEHSVVLVGYRVHTPCHRLGGPSTTFDEAKKYVDEKRQSHADSPGRKSLKKYDEQFTPSTSDTFRWFFTTPVTITNPTTMQVEFASRREPNAVALCGAEGDENIMSGMDSQELSIRNTISADVACSELEAMEWDARKALFYQDSAIQYRSPRTPKTGKRCRQSGCDRIFNKLRSCDDARISRYSESIRRTKGRKWKKSGKSDWIRSMRRSTWSQKPYVAWTSSSSSSRREKSCAWKVRCTRNHSHTL